MPFSPSSLPSSASLSAFLSPSAFLSSPALSAFSPSLSAALPLSAVDSSLPAFSAAGAGVSSATGSATLSTIACSALSFSAATALRNFANRASASACVSSPFATRLSRSDETVETLEDVLYPWTVPASAVIGTPIVPNASVPESTSGITFSLNPMAIVLPNTYHGRPIAPFKRACSV
ncbi:MAG: hypothetical protein E7000_00425 [Coriobacteriaceae bacterium]|nr:hypothetical protein [Coriobacteriaceae bacterium]